MAANYGLLLLFLLQTVERRGADILGQQYTRQRESPVDPGCDLDDDSHLGGQVLRLGLHDNQPAVDPEPGLGLHNPRPAALGPAGRHREGAQG
jgi:hypothetical protein